MIESPDRSLPPLATGMESSSININSCGTTSLPKTIPLRWMLIVLAINLSLLAAGCGNGPPVAPTLAPAGPTLAADAGTPKVAASVPAPVTKTPATQPASPAPTPVQVLPTPSKNVPTLVPDTPTPPPTPDLDPLILQIVEGTSARYLVKEQFLRLDLPNDAIGETSAVSGSIRFRSDGSIDPAGSKFVVELRPLSSDDQERDEFLEEESLESNKFSVAEFVIEDAPGLPWPLPQDGQHDFQLRGEMTVHGVTSPTTWEVTAQFTPQGAIGQARTRFNFAKFDMEKPSAFFLLSVEDLIRLELDFVLGYGPPESIK